MTRQRLSIKAESARRGGLDAEPEREAREIGSIDFRDLFDSAQDPVCLLDDNYAYQAVNPAYENYFNKNNERIVGSTVDKIVGEENFHTIIKPNLDRCLKGEPVTYESWMDIPLKGFRYMNVSYYPRKNSTGRVIGLLDISRDFTEHKKFEARVQEERNNLRNILLSLDIGLCLINPDLTISWANEMFRDMFPGVEPVGSYCHELFGGRQNICEGCGILNVFRDGNPHTRECFLTGLKKWRTLFSAPIRGENAQVIQVLQGIREAGKEEKT